MTLCAVTKGQPTAVVALARAVGLTCLGENYSDELLAKASPSDGMAWNFLGPLQRNKIGKLAPVVARFQGLARLVEAETLARVAPGASVLVQVDATEKKERNGVPLVEVPNFLAQLEGLSLSVDGLMTVAPEDRSAAIACFKNLADLAREASLPVVSMGMSGDLSDAIAAGSTMIRVGSALFGPRGEYRSATQG